MEEDDVILFHAEDVEIPLANELISLYRKWLLLPLQDHKKQINQINYVFCSDEYLLAINRTYLQHDYYTDVITFDHTEKGQPIESDIFISVERVRENAQHYNVSFEEELRRVMIHGILHLCGYKDKTASQQRTMRQKEDEYLKKLL
ncbi:MAG: rRNA maturation RNase YbeY [Cytophagales bacterium]|nr:rRNA maturation RNase YbeY [Cytophagales bacterium]MDW8385099.1 rRNA maturation RNase YbeY [Flammeovirgaceae bacterium]